MKYFLNNHLALIVAVFSIAAFNNINAQEFSDPLDLPQEMLISNYGEDTNYVFSFDDMDDDGDDDCITTQYLEPASGLEFEMFLQLNQSQNGNIAYSEPQSLFKDLPIFPVIMDVNNDNKKDIIAINGELDNNVLRFLINTGDSKNPAFSLSDLDSLILSNEIEFSGQSFPVVLDANNDSYNDLLFLETIYIGDPDSTKTFLYYLENDGIENEISFTYKGKNRFGIIDALGVQSSLYAPFIDAIDANGDNNNDLIITTGGFPSPANITLLTNDGLSDSLSFSFAENLLPDNLYDELICTSGDIDNDGDNDIVYWGYNVITEEGEYKYLENQLSTSTENAPYQNAAITTFPNPASDQLVIQSNSFQRGMKVTVSLHNINGEKILERNKQWHNQMKLNIPSNVSSGSYILLMNDGKKHARKKIQLVR